MTNRNHFIRYSIILVASIASASILIHQHFSSAARQAKFYHDFTNSTWKAEHEMDLRFQLNRKESEEAPYLSSLELRENAEFLLTPCILIQESISSNSLIIYPNE